MSTFSLIIEKSIHPITNCFSLDYNNLDKIPLDHTQDNYLFIKLFFSSFISKPITIQSKFMFFKETLNNLFIVKKRNEFIVFFCQIQKIYKALNKFAYLYKYKKSKIVVNTDMVLNTIHENEKNIICIFQKNSKYLFHIEDIIKIINSCLTNNHFFFIEPLSIKNPYNNIPFNKSTLYNIYIYVKYKTFFRPELLFHFFNCDFNLYAFITKYEYLLKEYAIHNFVYKSTSDVLIKEIHRMIYSFNVFCKEQKIKNRIDIDKEFPKEKLIKIMQPYLLLYYTSKFSLLNYKKIENLNILRNLLIKFNTYNRQFGRKKYKIQYKYTKEFKKNIFAKIIEFDDKHIPFNNIQNQNRIFLEDHLIYTRPTYNNLITRSDRNFNSSFFYDTLDDDHMDQHHMDEDEDTDVYEDTYEDTDEDEDTEEDENNVEWNFGNRIQGIQEIQEIQEIQGIQGIQGIQEIQIVDGIEGEIPEESHNIIHPIENVVMEIETALTEDRMETESIR